MGISQPKRIQPITYAEAGTFMVILAATAEDGTTVQTSQEVTVVVAQSTVYPIYTENPDVIPDVIPGLDMNIRTWDGTFPPTVTTENVLKGNEAVSFNIAETSGYGYGGFVSIGDYIDFSEYKYVYYD